MTNVTDPLDFKQLVDPRFMPGYKGHIPNIKYQYGETFGNLTANYLRTTRHKHLASSKANLKQGGIFCTFNTSNGSDFCQTRARQWQNHIPEASYKLSNQDTCARMRQTEFVQKRMAHRDHYKDTTGTVLKEDFFHVAKDFETREVFLDTAQNLGCQHVGVPW